jgi:hypothetical protein
MVEVALGAQAGRRAEEVVGKRVGREVGVGRDIVRLVGIPGGSAEGESVKKEIIRLLMKRVL